MITGVRWDESTRRKTTRAMLELNAYSNKKIMLNNDNDEARRMFESCQLKGKHILNPIIDWTTEDVWEYLDGNSFPHCCLYDEGFARIGCIGCPMSGMGRWKHFADFPTYQRAYVRAFDRMLERLDARKGWKNGWDVFLWWMEDKNVEGQMSLADFAEESEW